MAATLKGPESQRPPALLTPVSPRRLRVFLASLPLLFSIAAPSATPASAAEAQKPQTHWSLLPPERPKLPHIMLRSWVRNPIDSFILSRLESEGTTPSAEAERSTLIRRLYLDLIGLPPPPEALAAFLADHRPDAYERLVTHLLSSAHYGEKWARHWLDLARYADSDGYNDGPRTFSLALSPLGHPGAQPQPALRSVHDSVPKNSCHMRFTVTRARQRIVFRNQPPCQFQPSGFGVRGQGMQDRWRPRSHLNSRIAEVASQLQMRRRGLWMGNQRLGFTQGRELSLQFGQLLLQLWRAPILHNVLCRRHDCRSERSNLLGSPSVCQFSGRDPARRISCPPSNNQPTFRQASVQIRSTSEVLAASSNFASHSACRATAGT